MRNDEELMQRTSSGDLSAFNEIVSRYQNTAWRLALRFISNTQDAKDIAQEAFIRIFKASSHYRHTSSFTTYLYRVIVRLCMDSMKKKRETIIEDIEDSICPDPNPSQQMIDREREKSVRSAISRLPSRQRIAIILREYMDLPYSDIAEILHTSNRSVERLLARARDTLRHELKEFWKK